MNLDLPADRRFLCWLFVTGLCFRLFVSVLTSVPSYDGTNYIWMAEQFAKGNAGAALSEVFPPLLPLVIAPFLWLELDPFRTAQVVCCIAGALALIPAVRATEAALGRGGRLAGCFLVCAHLPVRFAGEVYTEPLFHLFAAYALYFGLRERWLWMGIMSGVTFWLRPEGALIAFCFVLCRPKQAWKGLIGLSVFVIALALWRDSEGHGASLVAKFAFNNSRLWAETPEFWAPIGLFFENLIQIPWLWVEAFALLGLLALYGLLRCKEQRVIVHKLIIVLGILVICTFLARRRFLVSWIFVLPPLAILAYERLNQAARFPVLLVLLLTSILLSLRVTAADRYGERIVGEYLLSQLEEGEVISGDMTRSLFFARQRPLPPRHLSPEEILERASLPGVRFVVLLESKASNREVTSTLFDRFQLAKLPYEENRYAERRGMIVLERRD